MCDAGRVGSAMCDWGDSSVYIDMLCGAKTQLCHLNFKLNYKWLPPTPMINIAVLQTRIVTK